MQYDAQTPKEYLELLDADWRKDKLLDIRRMILDNAPELEESIKYKMLSYGDGSEDIFGLNAQKHYVSLYVGNIDKIDSASTLLEPFSLGKGCIRVRKSVDIHKTELEEFIKAVIDIWRSGGDTSC